MRLFIENFDISDIKRKSNDYTDMYDFYTSLTSEETINLNNYLKDNNIKFAD